MADFLCQRQAGVASCSGRPFLAIASCLDACVPYRCKYGRSVRLNARAVLTEQASQPKEVERDVRELASTQEKVCRSSEPLCTANSALEAVKVLCCRSPALLASSIAFLEVAALLLPEASTAGEALPVEFMGRFLDKVENLGVYGPVVFVATMIGAEMVPLFPTQPLSIASGLLFGGPKGSALALIGTTTAAILAFQLSRRVGRRLAERVIAEEIGEEGGKEGMFSGVQAAIDSGSFQQQLIAVTLLRLTPVVPFSASNYLLGATPLKFGAYLAGSVLGLSFWCVLFATLGGASRGVLKSGLSLDALYGDLLAKAGSYTQDVAVVVAILAVAAVLFYKFGPQGEGSSNGEWR